MCPEAGGWLEAGRSRHLETSIVAWERREPLYYLARTDQTHWLQSDFQKPNHQPKPNQFHEFR